MKISRTAQRLHDYLGTEHGLFRLLLAVVVYHYAVDALSRSLDDWSDWIHLVSMPLIAPLVLVLGWRFSRAPERR